MFCAKKKASLKLKRYGDKFIHRFYFHRFLIIFFLLQINIVAAGENKIWKGKLDDKGKAKIEYKISAEKTVFLQAFIFYKDNWRPVSVFWNDKEIWIDLGPAFKELEYRVHLLIDG
ncbi:MAG: hypothetical protein OEZ13_00520 [Spirochaetia bacterium]|nr:hypothetical protein [Spirochaetia bacterium]